MNSHHMQIASQFTAAITQGMREQANPVSLTHWYNVHQGYDSEAGFYKWSAKVGTMVGMVFEHVMNLPVRVTYIGEPLYEIGELLGKWLYRPSPPSDQQIQKKIGELCWDFFNTNVQNRECLGRVRAELKLQTGLEV